jgi:hypothetical protein
MINFAELSGDGEAWELFARDFLSEMGFQIEVSPDRGADRGKDILVVEHLGGILGKYQFRWLVSCKNFSQSGRSVSEKDELNLQERMVSFEADGFIGFYSTIASTGLNSRLNDLKRTNKIQDCRVFDARLIEQSLIRNGDSNLIMRYFPDSYLKLRPLHAIWDGEYIPVQCSVCSKDILEALDHLPQASLIKVFKESDDNHILDYHCICGPQCKASFRATYLDRGLDTEEESICDLTIPVLYIKSILQQLDEMHDDKLTLSDKAVLSYQRFLIGLAQKVLRQMSEEDTQRVEELISLDAQHYSPCQAA